MLNNLKPSPIVLSVPDSIDQVAVDWSPNGEYVIAGYGATKGWRFHIVDRKTGMVVFSDRLLWTAEDIGADTNLYISSQTNNVYNGLVWFPDNRYIAIRTTNNFTLVDSRTREKVQLPMDFAAKLRWSACN